MIYEKYLIQENKFSFTKISDSFNNFDEDDFNRDIKSKCSEYLKLIKGKNPLYASVKKGYFGIGKTKGSIICSTDMKKVMEPDYINWVFPLNPIEVPEDFEKLYRSGAIIEIKCKQFYYVWQNSERDSIEYDKNKQQIMISF